jgi:hypothetical protein
MLIYSEKLHDTIFQNFLTILLPDFNSIVLKSSFYSFRNKITAHIL